MGFWLRDKQVTLGGRTLYVCRVASWAAFPEEVRKSAASRLQNCIALPRAHHPAEETYKSVNEAAPLPEANSLFASSFASSSLAQSYFLNSTSVEPHGISLRRSDGMYEHQRFTGTVPVLHGSGVDQDESGSLGKLQCLAVLNDHSGSTKNTAAAPPDGTWSPARSAQNNLPVVPAT